ncbi:MAG: carbohydrate ABC transporter permease [Candidatus Marinimicrobia bacterium]|nr:carbohydrate ABC transporter permease [Candidatus Neomarinimicrobiota bacterium]
MGNKPFSLSKRLLPSPQKVLHYAVLIFLACVFILPFLWMLSTSLKGYENIFSLPLKWIPDKIHWENYVKVFQAMPFLVYLKNSVFVTSLAIFGTVLSASVVAYAFAVLRWPGRNALFIVVIATMMLPAQVTMIPLFVLFKEFGWLNTFKPLIIPAFFGGGAFNIFLLRQFFLTIPKDLVDAARIDGCSEFRIYWNIVLPLAKPAIATVAVLSFMLYWNDFLGPLIYLSDKLKGTLALGVVMFVGQHQSEWALLMVATILMMLPIIIIFFLFQRYFIRGFMMSGIKG